MDNFYNGKSVLITGHTGFKGTWLSYILASVGAQVTGYALEPQTEPNIFDICGVKERIHSVTGDVRDLTALGRVFEECRPEIVFHLAAQPIVRTSYTDPVYTYGVNVMGTVNVCECVRRTDSVRSLLNVTTDKVYENKEWCWGYREDEPLNGYDPYSNSKSCSELVTDSYRKSFLQERGVAVSTARAGNVIGGGDFSVDRIIPDCVRAAVKGEEIILRNPSAVRPYQHVLEPLRAYMLIAQKQYEDGKYAGNYNVGPDEQDAVSTGEVATLFCDAWGNGASWRHQGDNGPHEANFLKLDCSKIKNVLGWRPEWKIKQAVEKAVEWYAAYYNGEDMCKCMDRQIAQFWSGERQE